MTSDKKSDWIDLSGYNSLAIPARAQRVITVTTYQELVNAVEEAQQAATKFLVLGEGSNTVFAADFAGTIIVNRLRGISVLGESERAVELKVAAGESWHGFVSTCIDRGWFGLENLALIPGTVGAAPIQNIGAYGVEVKDTISAVEVVDTFTGEHLSIRNQECLFGYRESRFKTDWAGNKVIVSVTFSLSKQVVATAHYPALQQCLPSCPTPRDVFNAVVAIRSEKLPLPNEMPNAGSFFKNPIVDGETYLKIKAQHPGLVAYQQPNDWKLAAAWLIEQAGWKNRTINGVGVHKQQALVVINPKRRCGADIINFAQAVQQDIKEKYDVDLEIEPQVIL